MIALIAGTTYAGSAATGGSVKFTVAPDGSRVTAYEVRGVPGDSCVFVAVGTEGDWEGAPIVNGAFEYRVHDVELFQGSIPDPASASGTLRYFQRAVAGVRPACD